MPTPRVLSPGAQVECALGFARRARPVRPERMQTMDYVALLRFRSATTAAERDAALVRRAGWQYPASVRLIAEYWPMAADVQVVSIVNTDDAGTMLEFVLEWSDVFDIDIHP